MPLINLEQFKTLFPETKVEISDEQVKWYVKENIYKGSDPVYENGANEQMQLLIEKANELGLKNFKDLFKHAENKQIKESVEAILYLLQGKDISLYQDRTFECGPGTLTNLQSIIFDIKGVQSLQSVVSRYRKEMLEEFAKELLKKGEMFFKNTLDISDGMEVHNVTSILNVIADDFGVIKDIKDPYVHNFTDNEVIKKIKDYYTEEIKKLTSGDISDGIVAKFEQSLLEFDKFRINEEDYANKWYFQEFSNNVQKYENEMSGILGNDSLFAKILMMTDGGVVIGFKDNYRDILKDFIALYLDDKKVIKLDEAEKKEIITKVKIETRSAFTEGEINDEVLKYAIAHDLYIDMGTELSAIDPVQKYLKSGDVLKRQYAIDHIKNNCDKYGGNATEITSQVENPTNAYYTYSDFITQRKFDKASAIARFFDKYNEKVAKSASLDESEKGNTTHIIDLLKAEELRKLREYNAQKEVILSRNKDGKRPLDTLFVNPLFSSITSNDRDSIMSILSEARECTILREVLTAKDKNGYTALHLAADSGNADVVENILAAIGDNKELLKEMLNVKDRYGETALHLAAKSDNADLVEKILTAANDAEVLKDLLTATDVYGETALHLAAESGKTDVVSKILAAIGDNKELLKEVLNVKDRYGYGDTALLSAAKSDKADVVEKILAAIGDNKELLKEVLIVKNEDEKTVVGLAVTRFATVPTDTSLGKIFEVAKKLDILGEVVGGCGDSFSCLFIKNPVRISDNITLCSSDYFVKECKDLVTPAKWSNIVPSIWVKNTSETGTYWKERDALIEKVVEKYLTDHRYIKTTDKDGNQTYLITEQIDKIKSEIRDNIASHKEEITEFLNEKGHYNVQPKIIKEELEKRDKGGKSFVEKLQEKKSISDTFMPFNVK